MGVVSSKSPLERRNTVLRRSQRKSIHGVKSKADKLTKDITKFKGIDQGTAYVELKSRIETLQRDLRIQSKNLQPQIRNLYSEALKRTEGCYKLLDDKLKENQEKAALSTKTPEITTENNNEDDDVFVEEIKEDGENSQEPTVTKPKPVELKLVQIEHIEDSPQLNKRLSVMKVGVPVMPGSMMEALNRKTMNLESKFEDKIAEIRKELEDLENEISQFVGKKNGKYYNKIKQQLEAYTRELKEIVSNDEAITEQVKMCQNYIGSCMTFLDEKAVGEESDDDYDDVEEVPSSDKNNVSSNLSPRSMRTTYI